MSDIKNKSEFDEFEGKYIEDHVSDGIRELDNPPPPWWNWLFYLTIIWAVAYMFHYHVFKTGDLQDAEYAKEMAALKPVGNSTFDETKITLITDAASIEKTKALYTKTCVVCHGENGEGKDVGPNLCDSFSIHGNNPADVFKIIKYGMPAKSMTPFKDQLTNTQIVEMTSLILTKFYGSNPANGKAPQGNKIETAPADTTVVVAAPSAPAEEAKKAPEVKNK
jgi:cytochrome c oxidase cbb3-type subunit 3